MSVSREEVERWLGAIPVHVGVDALVNSFNSIEQIFGRSWLEEELASESLAALSVHLIAENMGTLGAALRGETLRQRVRSRDAAARSELHALALCVSDKSVEIEVEPSIVVGDGPRVPDFRLRRGNESWVHVEVTAPDHAETQRAAQAAARRLAASLHLLSDRMSIEVRFRDEPSEADIAQAEKELSRAAVGMIVDTPRFIVRAVDVAESASTGPDELDRPVVGSLSAQFQGPESALVAIHDGGNLRPRLQADHGALIAVRVPFVDERAQRVLHAEAKQIPKEGPGLICIRTPHGQWRGLIERSFSPRIRRRISGVLMFTTGIRQGDRGHKLSTIARLILNPHARAPLPEWLQARLSSLPASF